MVMMKNENTNQIEILGGSLEKLVESLFDEQAIQDSPYYIECFIHTHNMITTLAEVLQITMKKYNELSSSEEKRKKYEKVRWRMFDAIKIWVETAHDDWHVHLDEECLEEFKTFVKTTVCEVDGPALSKPILKCINEKNPPPKPFRERPVWDPRLQGAKGLKKQGPPKPIMPKRENFTFDDLDATELARQLTLFDFDLFRQIKPREFTSMGWTKENKHELAPHLTAISARFNAVSRWFQYLIVSVEPLRQRTVVYEKIIKIGCALRKLKNFNGVNYVISALEGAACGRLNRTIAEVKRASKKKYEELKRLMSGSVNYKAYRMEIEQITGPYVPYMGVTLTDLVAISETHKKTLHPKYPDYLNFNRLFVVCKFINQLKLVQEEDYCFQLVPSITEWIEESLAKYGQSDEDFLYDLSLKSEPRPESWQ
eukprot:CAMPEP_0174265934 /NCGR_PEP_ID=MMETSP0439-20130205/28477_1 /TAXON_ID=0 /ORGANISM="Stereomyxa ramosa, Strain Chinc5" /LENGTH=425 /DNA_ID=CAMNT_0015352633 /DNA_START=77 /DNA_END=1354 /DNA_ORIENTATION=-